MCALLIRLKFCLLNYFSNMDVQAIKWSLIAVILHAFLWDFGRTLSLKSNEKLAWTEKEGENVNWSCEKNFKNKLYMFITLRQAFDTWIPNIYHTRRVRRINEAIFCDYWLNFMIVTLHIHKNDFVWKIYYTQIVWVRLSHYQGSISVHFCQTAYIVLEL